MGQNSNHFDRCHRLIYCFKSNGENFKSDKIKPILNLITRLKDKENIKHKSNHKLGAKNESEFMLHENNVQKQSSESSLKNSLNAKKQ